MWPLPASLMPTSSNVGTELLDAVGVGQSPDDDDMGEQHVPGQGHRLTGEP